MTRVVLISTPWPLYTRPSIQLGALKSYLSSQFATVKVDAHHFYLALAEAIGYKRYHEISERTWMAESIYAALLYPQRFEKIETLFTREAARSPLLKEMKLDELRAQIKKITDTFIEGIDWGAYDLAGFSVSLCQLTSSLYFIESLKQKYPNLLTVMGGSTFSADAARHVFSQFPEIDVVIIGEGELPFGRLVQSLNHLVLNMYPQCNFPVKSKSEWHLSCYYQLNQIIVLNDENILMLRNIHLN